MNTKQLDFAYKVRHALNETLANLPDSTTERLALSRKIALSSKKMEQPKHELAPYGKSANLNGSYFSVPLSWIARLGMAVPAIVVIVGLITIYQFEQQRHIRDLAEIDALVLVDELPLSAYLDHGFNAYLASRGE